MTRIAAQLTVLAVFVVTLSAEEPARTARDMADLSKSRSIATTATRGIAFLNANDYEGFLRELLLPADWHMLADSERLRTKFLRRVKEWDDEITAQLRNIEGHDEGDLAFNGDRSEVVIGSLEHRESGEAIVHAISLRRIGDVWYLNWIVKGNKDFAVRVRDRERIPSAPSN